MAKAKKHISWIDLLRIWAAFWVIVSHVQSSFYWNDGIETKGGIEQLVLAGFSRFAVPVFIMISGTLFLHCNEVCSLKENGKRIFRLLVILLFWNCFYAFFTEFHSKDWQFDRFIKNLTCGNYHLWYLYMLIGVYVTIPILQYISKNKTLLVYLTVLSCIFTSIIPTLRKVQFFSNSEIFNTVIDTINFKFALGGGYVFFAGISS